MIIERRRIHIYRDGRTRYLIHIDKPREKRNIRFSLNIPRDFRGQLNIILGETGWLVSAELFPFGFLTG